MKRYKDADADEGGRGNRQPLDRRVLQQANRERLQSNTQLFFFFQAEDGIRDADVTGVQTCALPIWPRLRLRLRREFPRDQLPAAPTVAGRGRPAIGPPEGATNLVEWDACTRSPFVLLRSEERRVGKECRSR